MKFKLKDIENLAKDYKAKKTGSQFIDDRVEGMRNPDGYVADYYSFFVELMKLLKPKTLVELGAWQGTSASCFAYGSPTTLVATIDHHTDPGDEGHREMCLAAEKEFENLNYCQGWTCDTLYKEQKDSHHLGTGQNAFPKVKSVLGKKKIDVLFIDSWHEYSQAKKDWDAYKPLLSNEALVICDDIIEGTPGSGIDNMQKFWDEMEGDKFLVKNLHSGYPMGFVHYKKKK